MKKKLMFYILSSMIFIFGFVTVLFITILNYQRQENVKENLKNYNGIIMEFIKINEIDNNKALFKKLDDLNIRVTILDIEGNVKFDSKVDKNNLENHKERSEFKDALVSGEGYGVRVSKSLDIDTVYYASKFDNYIIRTSQPVKGINGEDKTYIFTYVTVVGVILLITIWVSSKLSYIIVKPIMDLENTTSMIAQGELDRRVKVTSKDEIGQLGASFNKMANKLEYSLNEVKEKQNRLSAILQSMDSGVIAIDINDNIIIVNAYTEKIFGINEDVIGKNINTISKNFDISMIFKDIDDHYKEVKIDYPKEAYLRVRTADIINRNHHIGKVAVIQDVTDVKKLENVRTEFVANVSHELKTPLTSIKGFTETLRYVDDIETRDKFLDIIEEEADRLTRLISDILILSDIELQKDFKKEIVDVNRIISHVDALMRNVGDRKDVNIVIKGEKVPNLVGDSDKFKQMLINLVDNAIKYSESEEIIINTYYKDNQCIIEIEDKGIGISRDHISRLFERFYRVDKARSRAKGGTGLGLAIVKHIVLGFNGNISVESELNKGTKFIITIPYS
ncbi:sensory box protein [Clostridium argentinense CDC 2741]|uniref:histidine kinase n=1 Tax=Clostridium argentinense CDC 2741 TaxID=1418104 RepID=A0A0C1U4A1_9CLOT|nr:ATP-binding protein [Clostridium argentinense]ARC84646.1 two-component sensor histidine kinase [Clostridium argentinense]KIE47619.1 sensory box protein [Clostridium argentinense CDC 2741]NFF40153.1 HAMP domain-containing histidine kinase [Clostridium argentinense]NFP50644.1 HAMP domain-containing histidine kinase [Clostridium argentinense]NFP72408.1 HAMP domain-containing histidine kinase [Clostridium argentinense]